VRHYQFLNIARLSYEKGAITHHLVEARGVLEAVPDLQEGPLLLLLLASDLVELAGQLLHVRPEMLDRFQSVSKITEIKRK
jgi:hypothetical protein